MPDQPGVKGQPGSASNFPLLGRKCTAFEGGTRVAAFVSGGLIPTARRGTTSTRLMSISDWYPTFCALAGVDARDSWHDPVTQETHGIDGVDLWPTLSIGDDNAPPLPRQWLPTTERSLLWDDRAESGHMYKLVVNESQANRFHRNGSQFMDTDNACLTSGDAVSTTDALHTSVPPSCTVCSEQQPCVYDVAADPMETTNLASRMPNLTAKLRARLAIYKSYVPSLSPENLACYNCTGLNERSGNNRWEPFWGPCCMRASVHMHDR